MNLPGASRAPKTASSTDHSGRRALGYGVAGALVATVVLPLGLVLVLAGLVLGVRARRRARRTGVPAPGAVLAIVIGVAGALVTVFGLVAVAVFHDEVARWNDCQAGATTHTAQQQCRTDLENGLRRHLGVR